MTLLFLDGFELTEINDVRIWDRPTSGPAINAGGTYARHQTSQFGCDRHMNIGVTTGDRTFDHYLGKAYTNIVVGIAYATDYVNAPASRTIWALNDTLNFGRVQVTLCMRPYFDEENQPYYVEFRNSSSAIATSKPLAKRFYVQRYHYFEVSVGIDNTTGYVEIWADGEFLLSETGIDTQSETANTADYLRLGESNGSPFNGTYGRYDDLYIQSLEDTGDSFTGQFLGPIIVNRLGLQASGTANGWRGSDGNYVDSYTLFNGQTRDGNSSYVEASGEDVYINSVITDMYPATPYGSLTNRTFLGIPVALGISTDAVSVPASTGTLSVADIIELDGGEQLSGNPRVLEKSYQPLVVGISPYDGSGNRLSKDQINGMLVGMRVTETGAY